MEKENKIKIITPEEALSKFSKWFDSRKKLAFLLTLIAGIITHITMITEIVMSQDGLWNSMDYFRPGAWEITLGRWGIALVERLNNFIAVPSIATISCILIMAVSAVILVDLFDFKSKISVVFTSLILIVTPTLTVTLLYVYTSVAYCFNFLISILVIWFIYKFRYKKIGFCLSTLCFMLSLSIYQSYIGVSVGLCAMMTILDLLKNEKKLKEIFFNILKTILAIIIGGILYYIATMIILKVMKLELSSYKGTQNVSIISSILALKTTLIQTYKDFFEFFLGDKIIYNTNFRREIVNGIFLIIFAIFSVIAAITIKEENKNMKIIKAILILVIIALLPVCLNIIDILVVGNSMYPLTTTQMILIIPLAFAIFEIINSLTIFKWIAIFCYTVAILTYYLSDNASYAALELTYNQAYATTIRIMDRIETTNGYDPNYPILFGGIIGDYNYPRRSSLYIYTVAPIVRSPAFHGSYSGSIGTWVKFIRIFCGIDVNACTSETYYKIVNSEEYKQMDNFPGENSVKVIDGVIVLKMSEDPYLPF